jgi:hypothetical protein
MSARIIAPTLLLIMMLFAGRAPIAAEQSVESFYDARFPKDCGGQEMSSTKRQQVKSNLRAEFKKVNPVIEAVGVLEIKCALDDNRGLIGAVVLGYGTVADPDQAYDRFRQTGNIRELLANEQYGIFQYDPSLTTLRKTVAMFPSQRWRDYAVTIELPSATRLSLRANGSYGDGSLREEFNIAW